MGRSDVTLLMFHVVSLTLTPPAQAQGDNGGPSSQASSNSPPEPMGEEISLEESQASPEANPASSPPSSKRKKVKSLKKSPKNAPSSPSEVDPSMDEESERLSSDSPLGEETDDENAMWESYKEGGLTGSMDEVTERIKIQDIVEPPSVYHYAAFGKPDPFRPITRTPISVATESQDVEVPIVSTLQTQSIQSMKILGIWQGGDGQKKAMITLRGGNAPFDGDDKGYVIKIGDPIGNRGGIVHAIKSDGVVIREFEVLADGTRHYSDMTLPFTLQITTSQPPLGSWIFKPGIPKPTYKSPPQAGQNTTPPGEDGTIAPNAPMMLPQNMLDTLNRGQTPDVTGGSARFTPPANNRAEGAPNGNTPAGAAFQLDPGRGLVASPGQGGADLRLNSDPLGSPITNQGSSQEANRGTASPPPPTSSVNNLSAPNGESIPAGSEVPNWDTSSTGGTGGQPSPAGISPLPPPPL